MAASLAKRDRNQAAKCRKAGGFGGSGLGEEAEAEKAEPEAEAHGMSWRECPAECAVARKRLRRRLMTQQDSALLWYVFSFGMAFNGCVGGTCYGAGACHDDCCQALAMHAAADAWFAQLAT